MSQTFVHIFSGSAVEVLALRDALQAVNIIPVIKDEAESARLAGFGATPNLQRVFVHPDEAAEAQSICNKLFE